MLDINVVIVNYKMRSDIERCLSGLLADLEESRLKAAVQVMDNSKNVDGVKELIKTKYPSVYYYDCGGNIGFGKAQNIGLKRVEAKFYLPLNPDIVFPARKMALRRLVDYLENNPQVGVVAPKLFNSDGSLQYSCCRFPLFLDQIARRLELNRCFSYFQKRVDYYLMKDFNHQDSVPVDWVIGSFMLIRQEAALKVGFFDERFFMYFEDCDLCRRMWRSGWEVHYVAEVALIHGHRRDSAQFNPLFSLLANPVARIHLKSWWQYFRKWGIKKEHFGI
ncbi:glycosyltransferase family 2 protein [Candidatus Parcubacteria bacterium]|nr:MAG: glycosyltransferase family 2 protein [Candidatus Parcubacteria bacterium]